MEKKHKVRRTKPMNSTFMLLLITIFQIVTSVQTLFSSSQQSELNLSLTESYGDFFGKLNTELLLIFSLYIIIEWSYFFIFRVFLKKKTFELEFIAFFLSGIGLVIVASVNPDLVMNQFIAILAGLAVFIIMVWFMADVERVAALRLPLGIASVILLAVTLVLAEVKNGALNWLEIGSFSIQPSELVKVAFIYVGAATLEYLQSTRNLTKYMIFSLACVGELFLMRDLGAALIFFVTFLIIAFMRSGDVRSLILICVGALMAALIIVMFKSDYVAARFATYRHVWENMDGKGFQQTRTLIYMASGGLFGVGIGNGKLKTVFASTTDLMFGVLCEEWGLIMGLAVLVCFVLVTVYAVQCAGASRSSFYAIASCAAAGMLLFQTALNVFGITDLLPLTGVTLPFISRGGSSMICCWAMFAFLKAGDVRTYPKQQRELEAMG